MTRYRYESDDPSPVQIDPSFAASPSIVSSGDVFEVPDDHEVGGAKVVDVLGGDKRFRKVKASEPVTTAYSGWTGEDLRAELDRRGVETGGARSNADLASLLVENDRTNPQPLGNPGSTLAPLDEEREPEAFDELATEPGGTEPTETPEA